MNAPAQKSAKPVAATARIGYVFKNKEDKEFTDPLKAYEGLALAQCGHYPLGANGSFHGGIHFAAGTKAVFTQDKGVRCIADGEVVAYRIDRRYSDATPADSTEPRPKDGRALRPYSSAFVLVRHRLQPPLPALPAPPKESAISNFGTSLCNEAGRPLAWLPQGATLRLTGRTNRDRTWAQVDELTTPDQAVWSVDQPSDIWVRISDLMAVSSARTGLARLLEQSEYRINPAADRPDPRQVRANCDARLQQEEHRRQCAAMANAPTLTWHSLYMHLGDLASYEANPRRSRPAWWCGDKASHRLPHKLDAVMVLDQPVPIRQGQIVGFLGEDVPSDAWIPSAQPISRELLHLEAFSGDDVPGFIAACRQWAQQLPEDKRTQLGLKSGDELRGEPRSDAPVIATVGAGQTFPLSALKQAKDAAGHIWRQVSARTTGTGTATGWIEEAGHRVSPWEWRDFQIIEAASNPAGTWWDDVQQFADYLRGSGIRPKETPLFAKIRSWLDRNGDGRLDERELDIALKDRLLSSLIGGLIVRHRSAWDVPDWKERFGAIDELIEKLGNHEDSVRYRAAEKERVRKLDWWSYVAAQSPGFPVDSSVYHFHPVALAGAFCSEGSKLSLEEARVRAFLRMIRIGEGTQGASGYEKLFGGSSFVKDHGRDFSDHPRIVISKGSYRSSAAGAYQVMGYTWDDPGQKALRKKYDITDFLPGSQDRYGAVILRHKRRALDDIKAGRIREAINKCNLEWASLPGSPHGQPTVDWNVVLAGFDNFLNDEMSGNSDLAITPGAMDDILG